MSILQAAGRRRPTATDFQKTFRSLRVGHIFKVASREVKDITSRFVLNSPGFLSAKIDLCTATL
jgi:hypothetical protein